MNRILYLIRGLPGSGKSTLAKSICSHYFEADMYFDIVNNGVFEPSLLKKAHEWCQDSVREFMNKCEPKIGVSNTFTQEWEYKPYEDMAKIFGYKIIRIIVENSHGSTSIHNVPEHVIDKMRERFEINL